MSNHLLLYHHKSSDTSILAYFIALLNTYGSPWPEYTTVSLSIFSYNVFIEFFSYLLLPPGKSVLPTP